MESNKALVERALIGTWNYDTTRYITFKENGILAYGYQKGEYEIRDREEIPTELGILIYNRTTDELWVIHNITTNSILIESLAHGQPLGKGIKCNQVRCPTVDY